MMVPVCTPCRGPGSLSRFRAVVPVWLRFYSVPWFRGSGGSPVPVWFRSGGLVWTHYGLVTPVTKSLQPVLGGSPSQTEPGGNSYHPKEFSPPTDLAVARLR